MSGEFTQCRLLWGKLDCKICVACIAISIMPCRAGYTWLGLHISNKQVFLWQMALCNISHFADFQSVLCSYDTVRIFQVLRAGTRSSFVKNVLQVFINTLQIVRMLCDFCRKAQVSNILTNCALKANSFIEVDLRLHKSLRSLSSLITRQTGQVLLSNPQSNLLIDGSYNKRLSQCSRFPWIASPALEPCMQAEIPYCQVYQIKTAEHIIIFNMHSIWTTFLQKCLFYSCCSGMYTWRRGRDFPGCQQKQGKTLPQISKGLHSTCHQGWNW